MKQITLTRGDRPAVYLTEANPPLAIMSYGRAKNTCTRVKGGLFKPLIIELDENTPAAVINKNTNYPDEVFKAMGLVKPTPLQFMIVGNTIAHIKIDLFTRIKWKMYRQFWWLKRT